MWTHIRALWAKTSLRSNIVLLSTVSCAVSTLLVALLCSELQSQSLRESSRELQLALVQDIADFTRQELNQTQRELLALGNALTQSDLAPDAQIAVVKALLEASAHLDHVDVFDAQGEWIDRVRTAGPKMPPQSTLPQAAQDSAMHEGQWIRPAQLLGGSPRQTWVIPLRASGKLTGFLATQVDLSPIQSRLRALSMQHLGGVAHELSLRSESGVVLASAHTPAKAPKAPLDPLKLRALPPQVGVAKDQGPDLGTLYRLSERPWVIVAKIPKEVAYAALHRVRSKLALAVTGSILLCMLVSFALARRMTAPLSALVQLAQRLAQRRFDHTGLLQRGDELGQLARALNQTVHELQLSDASGLKGTRDDAPIPSQTKSQRTRTRFSPDLLSDER